MSDHELGGRIQRTLEAHESAVKESIESLGTVERRLEEAADAVDEATALEDLGRALERHEERLERVVRTLDEHKKPLRELDDDPGELAAAMERARQRARVESTASGTDTDDRP